jgi:hypothetical protein
MFEELYDTISRLFSWRWPEAMGEVTAVDVERVPEYNNNETFRLAVAYKFSVGIDGPYTGESFWQAAFFARRRVVTARRKIRIHQPVIVRYRPDDPSVNTLDRRAWESL